MACPITIIDDPTDVRIEHYRNIRDRDLAGREGLFVAEGKVVLRVLLQTRRFEVLSLLILESKLAGLADMIAELPPHTPVYAATSPVLEAIAGFDVHRGILAIGRRREEKASSILPPEGRQAFSLGLIGIANHDNMGALFRNAAAFGAEPVLVDGTCCDPLYRKAIRVSVGAALKVPYARLADADLLCDAFEAAGYTLYALSPHGETDITGLVPSHRSALLFGAEGEGLPASVLRRAQTVRIDMAAGFDSLNVAAASAVALHHLRRFRTAMSPSEARGRAQPG